MKSQGVNWSFLSEMDKVLLKRYKLLPLLKNKKFMQYIASLIQPFQIRYGAGIPLSVAIELISTAIKFEPEVINLLLLEEHIDVREHALYLFSLAIIEQLAKIGYLSTTPTETKFAEVHTKLNKKVFIIHGRDLKPVKEVVTILREVGLNPIILHEQLSRSRTIVEKLEKYSDVGYAFVILTPDDIGGTYEGKAPILRAPMLEDSHFRARQKVILEFGYFVGLLGRDRVCCLYKDNVELPSDMHGIVYIPFKESVNEVKDKIVKELKAAGYRIKI